MNNLVMMHDQQAVTTSLRVAEIFSKRHADVIRAIEDKLHSTQNCAEYKSMFSQGEYVDGSGKANKLYFINRDGFSFIVFGFTGKKADSFKLQYIDAFNQMERRIKFGGFDVPVDYSSALRLAADQAEQIAKMKPKVDYFDTQMHNPGLMTVTIIAKGYGKSGKWLNKKLAELGIIYKQGKQWVIKQKYAKEGYTGYDNWADVDNQAVHPLLKWTQRGQKFIHDQLAAVGIQLIAEQMQLVEVSK